MYTGTLLIVVVAISLYSRTGYCQIADEAFDQLDSVKFKWTAEWLSKAYLKIWYVECAYISPMKCHAVTWKCTS